MENLKRFLVYAVGLIVGIFCGTWAAEIFSDTLDIQGAYFVSDKLLIPTNLSGLIESIVVVVIFIVTVELVERSGILK